jgi:tetratricopeptide (TPR) repeat protein
MQGIERWVAALDSKREIFARKSSSPINLAIRQRLTSLRTTSCEGGAKKLFQRLMHTAFAVQDGLRDLPIAQAGKPADISPEPVLLSLLICLGEAFMGSGPRWLLIVAIVLLGVGEWAWGIWSGVTQISQLNSQLAQRPVPIHLDPAKRHLFTREEANTFLAAAKQAEAIKDPLQRCLAYPDPPRSHWSRDAVSAYCYYRAQPVISFAEMQQLIQNGHAAELDKRLAQALQAQFTRSDSRELLDRTFYADFEDGSFDIRPTLDAWKRDSPSSAFAYAASGYAYVKMAYRARGGGYMADTPQSSVDAMDKLLAQADTDLRHAIALDPRVTPAYIAMVNAGGLSLGRDYGLDAARRGHAIAPDNHSIYDMQMWLDEPKWGGSLMAMKHLADEAKAHAKDNPMMLMLQSEEPFYEVDNCNCDKDTELSEYPAALDQLAISGDLVKAGEAADGTNHPEGLLIYASEALRFNPGLDSARIQRIYALVDFDEAAWGVADASHVLAASPNNPDALKVRGHAYESLNDYAHAEQDYRAALALDPSDLWSLSQLGDMFVYWTHDWDKGWDIADQFIKAHPEDPYGWTLRATIQEQQPRAGLKDTVEYFAAHFGSNPAMANTLARMRAALTLQTHSGNVLAGKGQPHS